ncbi:MAG: hypothetical protein ABSD40_26485, partial [Streptosporangiaceae bacterium]
MCAQPRAEFFGHIDAANVDLKGFTGDFYRRVCLAALDPVLETLLYLRACLRTSGGAAADGVVPGQPALAVFGCNEVSGRRPARLWAGAGLSPRII